MEDTPDVSLDSVNWKRRFTSRQFIVTLAGMGLVYHATMAGQDVGPLAAVVTFAIGGAAGVNLKSVGSKT